MTTRAPRDIASMPSRQPSGPWPNTTTVCPASTRARSIARSAHASGSANAARSAGSDAASGTTLRETSRGGSAMNSP